jgi:hypothetical protein
MTSALCHVNLDRLADEPAPRPLPRNLGRAPQRTQREAVLELAAAGQVNAAAVVRAVGCSQHTAHSVLATLCGEGLLTRLSQGVYVASAKAAAYSPHVALLRGVHAEHARQLAEAEAWLADKPVLPAARPPAFDAPRRR